MGPFSKKRANTTQIARKPPNPRGTPMISILSAYQVRPQQASVPPPPDPRTPYTHELVRRRDVEQHLQAAPNAIPFAVHKQNQHRLPVPVLHSNLMPRSLKENEACPPAIQPPDRTRPKIFNNFGAPIPRNEFFTEYSTQAYPYHDQDPATGRAFETQMTKKGKQDRRPVKPTTTDQHKNIQGVFYHPNGDKSGFVPAQEVYRAHTYGPPVSNVYGLPTFNG